MLPSKRPPFSAIHLYQLTQTKSMIMTIWSLSLTNSLRLGLYLPSGIAFSLFSPRPPQWSPSWPCGRRRGTPAGGWACAIELFKEIVTLDFFIIVYLNIRWPELMTWNLVSDSLIHTEFWLHKIYFSIWLCTKECTRVVYVKFQSITCRNNVFIVTTCILLLECNQNCR